MVTVRMLAHKIKRLELENTIKHRGKKILLSDRCGFDMQVSKDGHMAVASLVEHIYSKEQPDQLGILIEIEGIFKLEGIEGDESKKEAHIRCYDELFPYADMAVRYLAINSAMPGLLLRKQEMDGESIRMGEELEGKKGKIIGFPGDTDE